ncbi:MAG: Rrf2 family transcriptional regulator [Proteobacteria bacterium]|jgi:Rrf2 family protein|nr:Rrf2 family transcriptional regulator [Pseudomonadota bacterium]
MKLTKLEEQVLRLSLALARSGSQMTLPELAEEERLSEALVAKVLGKLRVGGIVNASRGRNGGYELAAAPERTAVSAVMRALGRPLVEGCFNEERHDDARCPHKDGCCLRPIWETLEEKVTEILSQVTLADLVRRESDVRDRLAEIGKREQRPAKTVPRRPARSGCTDKS